ncbi:MAG: SIMPL domain-containing protein [Bacteroidetes bacterium]|nr:SIMPL domain-containing protein [Bacteroidota bacterium]
MNFSKLLFTLLAFLFIVVVKTNGQNVIATTSEINYIDAIGSADTLITPDKIFIEITVRERYEGRTKVTIDSLEDLLKSTLIKIGMELKNLTLADANGDLVRIKWKKQDVLTSKNYSLMVSSASEVSKVYEELSKLKIQELSIEKVEHSKIEEFKKLIKIKAVQESKETATYMLASIGNTIGKTIRIEELAIDFSYC